jgi:uroporphyrinogen-III synthase
MSLILSTKVLTATQKRHLFLANLSLVEYDAIRINPLTIELKKTCIENAVFTSQNAVKIFFSNQIAIQNAFCVGEKTSALVEQHGVKVTATAKNAKELATTIAAHYSSLEFDFFCSKQRRNELPDILKANHIKLNEHHSYESVCNYKTFANKFDAVLCFSPLGVESYYRVNNRKPMAICIGETTAKAAKHYTERIIISKTTTIDSVIVKAIKMLSSS